MMRVSVVVPVHNAQTHIAASLDSLRKQTLRDFEVICVDDGSTDSSLEILRQYCELDSRFSVITQPQSGAGVARNIGMAKAAGKYLYFFDADDLLLPQALETACDVADATNADIVTFKYANFNTQTGETEKKIRPNNLPELHIDESNRGEYASTLFQLTNPAPWTKLFRRDFIANTGIAFQELPRANDVFFAWANLASAERVVVLPDVLINYRTNQSSNLQSMNDLSPLAIIEATHATLRYLKENDLYSPEVEQSFINAVLANIFYNLRTIKTDDSYKILFETVRDELFPLLNVYSREDNYFYSAVHAKALHELENSTPIEFRTRGEKKTLGKQENPARSSLRRIKSGLKRFLAIH